MTRSANVEKPDSPIIRYHIRSEPLEIKDLAGGPLGSGLHGSLFGGPKYPPVPAFRIDFKIGLKLSSLLLLLDLLRGSLLPNFWTP